MCARLRYRWCREPPAGHVAETGRACAWRTPARSAGRQRPTSWCPVGVGGQPHPGALPGDVGPGIADLGSVGSRDIGDVREPADLAGGPGRGAGRIGCIAHSGGRRVVGGRGRGLGCLRDCAARANEEPVTVDPDARVTAAGTAPSAVVTEPGAGPVATVHREGETRQRPVGACRVSRAGRRSGRRSRRARWRTV